MMQCPSKISKPCVWIEGETTVKNLISDIIDEIVNAEIPLLDGGVESSKWRILYKEREHNYVTYELGTTRLSGRYIHEETGLTSTVYQIPNEPSNYKASDGYFYEAKPNTPIGE